MRPSPVRAIIFDLDDTILAYDAVAEPCWRAVCRQYAGRCGTDPATLQAEIRRQSDWLWNDPVRHRIWRQDIRAARREAIMMALRVFGCDNSGLAEEMAALRTTLHEQRIAPFPGALETLQQLRERGIRLGLITNGAADVQNPKIDRFHLRPLFDSIIVEGEYGYGKPGFRVFHQTLLTLTSVPRESWMVGDRFDFDIAPAQTLGLHAVWHDVNGCGVAPNASVIPDRVIQSLPELLIPEESVT